MSRRPGIAPTTPSPRRGLLVPLLVLAGVLQSQAALAAQPEPSEARGYVDLVVGQGLHGALIGAEIVEAANIYGSDAEETGPLVGAVVGVAAGVFFGDMDMGHAMAVNHGSVLGFLHSAVLMDWGRDPDEYMTNEEEVTRLLVGQFIGTAGGAIAGAYLPHESGRIALAGSVAMWTGILGSLARDIDGDPIVHPGFLAAVDLGYLAGYVVWDELRWSRLSVTVIDGVGLLALWLALEGIRSAEEWAEPTVDERRRDGIGRLGLTAGAVGLSTLAVAWLRHRGGAAPGVAWAPTAGGGRMTVGLQW